MAGQDLVRLVDCLNLGDAEAVARALDVAGIPYYLNNENMAALFPGAMGGVSGLGLGRVVVMVPGSEFERACDVLRDLESDPDVSE